MRHLALAAALLIIPACSEAEAVPLCEKPEAMPVRIDGAAGAFFDMPNIHKLTAMMKGLNEGTCRLGNPNK
jgi:hypothetical protein